MQSIKLFSLLPRQYDDITRELKMADDRANKAGNDAKHFESLLREEQAKIVNLVNAKKSLENEVSSLNLFIYLNL